MKKNDSAPTAILMNKQAWYENRILWQAGKHGLLDRRCARFLDLPIEQQQLVRAKGAVAGRPVPLHVM
jgi:hypothetical protein